MTPYVITEPQTGRFQALCNLCDWESIWHLERAKVIEDAETHCDFGHFRAAVDERKTP